METYNEKGLANVANVFRSIGYLLIGLAALGVIYVAFVYLEYREFNLGLTIAILSAPFSGLFMLTIGEVIFLLMKIEKNTRN